MNALQLLSRAALALSFSSFAFGCGGSGTTAQTTPEKNAEAKEGGDAPDTLPPKASALSELETFAVECRQGLEAAKKQLPLLLAVSGARTEENLLVPYNLMLANIERTMALASL